MLKKTNGSLLGGRVLVRDILDCFEESIPDSLILGGSCVENENNIYHVLGKEYYLSDIDLLCIRNESYKNSEVSKICQRMLAFSKSLKQSNPYFHIGLKLRGVDQLESEVNSLYFRELSERSFSLYGSEFLHYFKSNTKFGFFSGTNGKQTKLSLLACGITRLWCNILFYPAILLNNDGQSQYQVWYNYFYARGCLDWVTFRLIQEGRWVQGYKNRYSIWKGLNAITNIERETMAECINTKLGHSNTDYRLIFPSGLGMGTGFCATFASMFKTPHQELNFVLAMNKYIQSRISGDLEQSKIDIDLARASISNLLMEEISCIDDLDSTWLNFRRIYSNFRFMRNSRDRIDHRVYTDFFLNLSISA